MTTDAPFHLPGGGKPHVNTHATTVAALNAQNIVVVGLTAPGSGGELAALAGATGGNTQPLSSNGANIAQAILDALEELTTDVWWTATCDAGLNVSLAPAVHPAVPGNTTVSFDETVSVAMDPLLEDQTLTCTVTFLANHYPDEGAPIGTQRIIVTVPSVPPVCQCVESVNPSGKNIPPAGNTTPPGNKGGVNEDGFYMVTATDNTTPPDQIKVFVRNASGSWTSSAYPNGSVFKITEAPGASSSEKPMGGGGADAVAAHITLDSDPVFVARDLAGNEGTVSTCLVPPPPK